MLFDRGIPAVFLYSIGSLGGYTQQHVSKFHILLFFALLDKSDKTDAHQLYSHDPDKH
jgi:hypothetical protein